MKTVPVATLRTALNSVLSLLFSSFPSFLSHLSCLCAAFCTYRLAVACRAGQCVTVPINQGLPCTPTGPADCFEYVCTNGTCAAIMKPDGTPCGGTPCSPNFCRVGGIHFITGVFFFWNFGCTLMQCAVCNNEPVNCSSMSSICGSGVCNETTGQCQPSGLFQCVPGSNSRCCQPVRPPCTQTIFRFVTHILLMLSSTQHNIFCLYQILQSLSHSASSVAPTNASTTRRAITALRRGPTSAPSTPATLPATATLLLCTPRTRSVFSLFVPGMFFFFFLVHRFQG